ncbi:MAG: hypothetical protein V1837_04950 [Candidatus Woesearchaeota archaeon]
MLEENKKYWIGVFVGLQILVIIRNVLVSDYVSFVWFCDFAPMLLVLAIMFDSMAFMKAVINLGLISQIIFLFNFFGELFFGFNYWGFSGIFSYGIFYAVVSFVLHLLLTCVFYLTYCYEADGNTIAYSSAILLVMFIASLILTPANRNVNYVYNSNFLGYTPPLYSFIWLPLSFFLLVIPTNLLQKAVLRATQK